MKHSANLSFFLSLALLLTGGILSCKKAPDTTPPSEVTNLAVVNGTGSVTLTWTDPADPDFEKVEICYYTDDGMACFGVLKGVQVAERTLHSGTEYLFVVKTIDEAGNKSAGVSANGMPDCRLDWVGQYRFTNYNHITVAFIDGQPGDTTINDTVIYNGTVEKYGTGQVRIIYAPGYIEPDLTYETWPMKYAVYGLIYPTVDIQGTLTYPGMPERYYFQGYFYGSDSVKFAFSHATHSGDESYKILGKKIKDD